MLGQIQATTSSQRFQPFQEEGHIPKKLVFFEEKLGSNGLSTLVLEFTLSNPIITLKS